jgi:hypothetical protein
MVWECFPTPKPEAPAKKIEDTAVSSLGNCGFKRWENDRTSKSSPNTRWKIQELGFRYSPNPCLWNSIPQLQGFSQYSQRVMSPHVLSSERVDLLSSVEISGSIEQQPQEPMEPMCGTSVT